MSRRTVLVVEDYEDLRTVFTDALTFAGFSVRQARDGMEALRMIDSNPPDLIVLDLGLPQVTGNDVLYELREHIHTRHIPVVVVTGTPDATMGVPGDCVLVKPVDLTELVRRVQSCLSAEDPA